MVSSCVDAVHVRVVPVRVCCLAVCFGVLAVPGSALVVARCLTLVSPGVSLVSALIPLLGACLMLAGATVTLDGAPGSGEGELRSVVAEGPHGLAWSAHRATLGARSWPVRQPPIGTADGCTRDERV